MIDKLPQGPSIPSNTKRPSTALIVFISIISSLPTGFVFVLFTGKLYAALATTFFFLLVLRWLFKIRKGGPGELDRQIDKAMGGEPSNDPRQMARWVR